MDLAPAKGELAALYVTLFVYAASSVVVFLMGIVFNWKIAREVGSAVARLAPPQLGGLEIREGVTRWLVRWQDEFRRVRRTITFLFAAALFVNAFAASNLITLAGTFERDDGVASQWQRWAGYTLAMTLTTAGMGQYYALETVALWIFALLPATGGMLMGVFVSLSSRGTSGGVAKVINFSIWGPVLLIALIPLFYIYTTYSIWRRWWRGFPIVVHVLFAILLWVVLWVGPEVSGPNTEAARTGTAWAYFVLVFVWYLVMMAIVYLWNMGPPRRRTNATDSVPVLENDGKGGGAKRTSTNGGSQQQQQGRVVVNLDPRSPNFRPPAPRGGGGSGGPPEGSRGRFNAPGRRGRP